VNNPSISSSSGKRSSKSALRPGLSPHASTHRRALPSPPVHPSNALPSAGGSSKLLLGVALVACVVASLFGSNGGALRRYARAHSSRLGSLVGFFSLSEGTGYGGWGQQKCATVAVEPQLSKRLHAALNLLRAELGGPNYQPYAYGKNLRLLREQNKEPSPRHHTIVHSFDQLIESVLMRFFLLSSCVHSFLVLSIQRRHDEV